MFDAATLWVLIRALGISAAPGRFASFMLSSLLRTFGFMPGGLGSFEAASVAALTLAGIPVPVALSATLLFRGLSFWLPMLPGLAFARAAPLQPERPLPRWTRRVVDDVAGGRRSAAAPPTEGLTAPRRRAASRSTAPTRSANATVEQVGVLWNQMRSPLLLLLLFAAACRSRPANGWTPPSSS